MQEYAAKMRSKTKVDVGDIPTVYPWYLTLLPDVSGQLWVDRVTSTGHFFDVFSTDGKLIAQVPLTDAYKSGMPNVVTAQRLYAFVGDNDGNSYLAGYVIDHRFVSFIALGNVGAQSASPESFAGCYQVELGAWSGPFPSGMPAGHQPPSVVRLDTTLLTEFAWQKDERRVSPGIAALERYQKISPSWKMSPSGDTVRITWSNKFVGTTLTLTGTGERLTGAAQAFHDVIGPIQPSATAVLTRRSCPDSLPRTPAP